MRIDHVTLAGPSLVDLRRRVQASGLPTEYGGPHSNGVTHMDLLGFLDGSYLELISKVEGSRDFSPLWNTAIERSGGPCAWAVRVEDIDAEVNRLRGRGVPVAGPEPYFRERPDGQRVEWRLAFPGEGDPGSVLPFLIEDTTPRARRTMPSTVLESWAADDVSPCRVTGVAAVVLAVRDIEATIGLFRLAYDVPPPRFHAGVAAFDEIPVILETVVAALDATEEAGVSRSITARLTEFGDAPSRFLLGVNSLKTARGRLKLSRPVVSWAGRSVAWLDLDADVTARFSELPSIGFVEGRSAE